MFNLDEPLKPAIEAFVNPENDENAHKTSLNTIIMQVHRHVKVEQLIQELGFALTNGDDKVRARATLLLAEVLTRLPELPLTPSALQLLLDFFMDRLADYPSVHACLQALVAIELHHGENKIDPLMTIELINRLTKALHIPQLPQAMRKQCFELMENALNQSKVCEKLVTNDKNGGNDFIIHFLNAMEGEKDPRNLLLCLRIAKQCMKKLENIFMASESTCQQFFEVTSCYFPITFTPPPNDPYGITSEELIVSLRKVFGASDLLAKFVLPFLLEKLASSAMEAKLDAIKTIVFVCEKYSINVMLFHLQVLAKTIYHEVIKGDKTQVIEASLEAITKLSYVIGRSNGFNSFGWTKFVVTLCQKAIQDMESNSNDSLVSVSAGKILAAIGKESNKGFAFVLEQAIPILIQQFKESTTDCTTSAISKMEACLGRILLLVNTIDREVDQSEASQPMRPYASSLIDTLMEFLSSSSSSSSSSRSKRMAIEALCHLVTYPPSPIVENTKVDQLIELFTNHLLQDKCPEVRQECLKSLKSISQLSKATSTQSMMSICLSKLMEVIHQLLDTSVTATIEPLLASSCRTKDILFQDLLNSITALCCQDTIIQATIERLSSLCIMDGPALRQDTPQNVRTIVQAMAKIIESSAEKKTCMEFCVTGERPVVLVLLKAAIHSATDAASKSMTLDSATLVACSSIFRIVIQNCSVESQQIVTEAVVPLFLGTHDNTGEILPSHPTDSTPASLLQMVPLFGTVVNSISKAIVLPESNKLIERLLEVALSASSTSNIIWQEAALNASKSLASIINKMPDGSELDTLIQSLLIDRLSQDISKEQQVLSVRLAALQTYIWIAKALIVRGHKQHAPLCLKYLCGFLAPGEVSNPTQAHLRMEVAKCFQLLLAESPDVLNRKCGATITFLYRQRLFELVFPVLLEYIRGGQKPTATPPEVLLALSHLVSNAPKAIYIPHIMSILPYIVEAINRDEKQVGSAAIGTFRTLLFESVENIKPFLKEVFPGLLKQAQQGAGAVDRKNALDCIAKLGTIPYELIHPYKATVLSSLLQCLNDRKRFVRGVAVRVRNQWSIL